MRSWWTPLRLLVTSVGFIEQIYETFLIVFRLLVVRDDNRYTYTNTRKETTLFQQPFRQERAVHRGCARLCEYVYFDFTSTLHDFSIDGMKLTEVLISLSSAFIFVYSIGFPCRHIHNSHTDFLISLEAFRNNPLWSAGDKIRTLCGIPSQFPRNFHDSLIDLAGVLITYCRYEGPDAVLKAL